jgi:hypothetical protein
MARIEMFDPENEIDIHDLWVFMSVDDEGKKGICAHIFPGLGSTPLLTGQPRVIDQMKVLAQEIAKESGKPVHLYRFKRDAEPLWKIGEQ